MSEEKAKEDAKVLVLDAENRANEKIASFESSYKEKTEKVKAHQDKLIEKSAGLDKEIEEKADEKTKYDLIRQHGRYDSAIKKHEHKYEKMEKTYKAVMFISLLYGLLTTVITALKTPIFVNDCVIFGKSIMFGIKTGWGWIFSIATFTAKLGDMIPHPNVSVAVHWTLIVFVIVVITGVIALILYTAVKKYISFFCKYQKSQYSIFAGVMILGATLFAADFIKSLLPINLMLLMLIVFVVYTVVRGMFKAGKGGIKKIGKAFGIVVASLAVIAGIIIFIGGIVMILVTMVTVAGLLIVIKPKGIAKHI